MSKHTPGPWVVRPDLSIETGQSGITVAGLVDMPADARLIAAAPAMYEALGNLLKMVEDGDYTTIELNEARAALAQAEGSKP